METLEKFFGRSSQRASFLLTAVVAILAAVVVCYEFYSYLRQPVSMEEPRLLVLRREISEGHPLHFLDLILTPRSKLSKDIPAGALGDQEIHLLKGALAARILAKGTVLTLDALRLSPAIAGLGPSVPKGFRAYLVEASNSLPLRAGDRVDIILRPSTPYEAPLTLVEGIQVLQAAPAGRATKVVVAAKQSDIRVLEKAQTSGKLTLILRNPFDNQLPSGSGNVVRQLTKHRAPQIEILAEEN